MLLESLSAVIQDLADNREDNFSSSLFGSLMLLTTISNTCLINISKQVKETHSAGILQASSVINLSSDLNVCVCDDL